MINLITRLFPRAQAWRIAAESKLRQLLEGFAVLPENARDFVDGVYAELHPDTTTNLDAWERQFGINFPSQIESNRRLAVASKWSAMGGQSPQYIEDTLRAAGFDVYVHEWWSGANVAPRTVRDPRTYATDPLIGEHQCIADADGPHGCYDGADGPQCTAWLMNEVNYIVNDRLSPIAPPPIPSDSDTWPYFIYIGGETFPNNAEVDAVRRDEFRELLLSLTPAHLWIVTLVDYVESYVAVDSDGYVLVDPSDYILVI